ncbi:aspartyl/asparaginyl beta-hydroxylase domain-containing protein [Parasphingorhabdus halotolerans]|nr:aspartyl/asparaginyl beta-hydroxylase domain-containing protein [Parasphingorhabdus halotolerans]
MIATEASQILRFRDAVPPLKEISPDHARIAGDGNWRSFFLVGYGFEVPENCARAPVTAALVKKIPDLNSAFFSILDPGAVIPRHRGVTRGLVTCHLGLSIPHPPEKCTMQVEDMDLHWNEGKWLVFDDSYFHQVHNDTDQRRIILLIQVKRPMRLLGRLVNDFALWNIRRSPFVQDARQNLGQWEEAFQNAERNEAA